MKKYQNLLISMLFVVAIIISGCTAGRGDWSYELTGGYAINRINAHGIVLVYSDKQGDSETYVIPNFYVTDFCMNQQFIAVQGIPTEDMWASDAELDDETRIFYLIDVSCDDVYGPYSSSKSFTEQCNTLSSGDMGEWKSTEDIR